MLAETLHREMKSESENHTGQVILKRERNGRT